MRILPRRSVYAVLVLVLSVGYFVACGEDDVSPTVPDVGPEVSTSSTSSWTCSSSGDTADMDGYVVTSADDSDSLTVTTVDFSSCLGTTRCGGSFCDGASYGSISGSSGADGWTRGGAIAEEWIPEYKGRYCPHERVQVATLPETSGNGDPSQLEVLEKTDANGGSKVTIDVPSPTGTSPWTFDYTVSIEGKDYDVTFTCTSS